MISKHDVVGGGRFTKWQLEVGGQTQGQSRHVTYVQQLAMRRPTVLKSGYFHDDDDDDINLRPRDLPKGIRTC